MIRSPENLPAPNAAQALRAGRRRLSRDERLAYLLLLPALGAVFVIVTIPFILVVIQSISVGGKPQASHG